MARLPTVTSNIPRDLRTFVDRVREALESGGPDAVVTARQLVAAGVATYTGANLGPVAPTGYAAPPRPQNVEANGALANIMITWDKPVYNGHAYAEIWAAAQTEAQETANENPTIGQAELVGMSPGVFFAHNLGAAAKRWYWVRFVNFNGDAGPYQGTEGVVGETSLDAEYVLEVLTGEITQNQLYSDLSSKVNRIDTKTRVFRQATEPFYEAGTTGSTDYPLVEGDIWIDTSVTYYDDYVTGDYVIRANRMNRWDDDAEEWVDFMDFGFQDWFTAINTEKTTRESEDDALAQQITTVSAAVTNEASTRAAAITTEQTARTSADSALAADITSLTSTVGTNYSTLNAAITAEQTARADEDTALAADITSLTATVSNNYTTLNAAVTSEATARTTAVDAVAQDVTDLEAIVDSNNTTVLAAISAESTARATAVGSVASDVSTIQADYLTSADEATLSAAIQSEATARANADTALSGQITTLEADLGADISAAVAVEAQARVNAVNDVESKYTVKVDAAGHIAGYGIIANGNTEGQGTLTSEFGVKASAFWVSPPAVAQATAPTGNLFPGYVWVDISTGDSITKYYTGSGWSTTPQNLPFVIRTTPTTINGESVPAGVYMQDAFIANGTITNAKIGDAAIDNAKIANLDAGKITTGTLDAARIAAGSIDANHIDSRGLSIKDADGNVILAAGSPLAVANISGLGDLATLNEVSYSDLDSALAGQLDGKVEQHYGTSDPSTGWTDTATKNLHIGDLWYHTSNKLLYVWVAGDDPDTVGTTETHYWQKIENQDAIDAADAASDAQDTADGKRRVFTAQPTVPYDVGDLWDRGSTTGLWRCVTAKTSTGSYALTDWQVVADKTGDNTAASITNQGIFATAGKLDSTTISTYISDAAIGLAQIDTANITNLAAIKADMGTITAGKMQSTDGKFVVDLDNKTITIET